MKNILTGSRLSRTLLSAAALLTLWTAPAQEPAQTDTPETAPAAGQHPGKGPAKVAATTLRTAPVVTLRRPLQEPDSLDFKGERFTEKGLLQTAVALDWKAGDDAPLLTADTAGRFTFEKAGANCLLYRLKTRIRTERFAKGRLLVNSNARFELFVDGQSKHVKERADDSLSQARPARIEMRMEPEHDYEIVIKLLSTPDDKAAPELTFAWEPNAEYAQIGCRIDPDMKRRMTLHDTAFGSMVNAVSFSPDGRYLLMTTSESYGPERSRTNTELIEVKTGRRVMHRLPSRAAWMPRTSKIYYTVQAKKGQDLMLLDPATGDETLCKAGIPEGRFTWSPTEDYLVYHQNERGEESRGPLKRLLMPDDRIPGSRGRSYLVRYDLNTGVSERLTFGHNGVRLNDISPDGRTLLCSTSEPDLSRAPFSRVSLFEIDLATMQTDTLVAADPYGVNGSYSPDGKQLLLLGSPEALGGAGKNCGAHPYANDYDVQAFLMERATRKVTPISRDFNPSIDRAEWNRTDHRIYFNTTDKDCRHIYRYTPATGRFEMLPLAVDVVSGFSIPADAPTVMAYCGGGSTSAGSAYLYDLRKGGSTLLADPMAEKLADIQMGEMEQWNFTAADGTLIEGLMCLPPDFDPERKYPLIVYYYGGTTPTTRSMMTPYSPQLFASRDYVVYVIQPSGATGFGQEFSARHVNAWGDYTADEIIEGTRKFCEAHPFVDAGHIGCLGASYGGFMTMYLQTKTDLFAAAASHAGISNVTSYWGEGYWGYSYNSVAAAHSYPWSHPDLFTQHGALFNADKIHTPLLLLHGTADTNVPIGESIQLYNALKLLGRPVEFVTVDGENHFIADYPKRVQWHNTIMAWFARWLQERPEWWNELYPERHW